jgi:hypothetical protein
MSAALRWVSRVVFVVALLTWGQLAIRSARQPETWAQTRRRTYAFVVMMAAGIAGLPASKRADPDEEETY